MANRIKMNRKGVAQLLHDPGVVADLEGRMSAAQAAYGRPATIETEIYPSGRAIVSLVADDPDSLFKESNGGELARSLDAAGGTNNPRGTKWGPR